MKANLKYIYTAILLVAAFSMLASAQELRWYELNPETVPPGRDDHMMVFDSNRGVIVMFGGDAGDGATWEWDGTDWVDRGIASPARRREAEMVFDKQRGVVVMYGGYDFVLNTPVIWEYDGEEWQSKLPEDSPDGRADHTLAYDEKIGLTLMYGGEGAVDGATWGFDGAVWKELASEEDSPGPRWGHEMVYDSGRQRAVMFGGVVDNAFRNDVWEWDGEKWIDVTPEDTDNVPQPRRDHVMVYDSRLGVTILIGGRDNSAVGFNDMWQWDGEEWVEIIPENPPSERHEMAAAFDSWRNKIVLFGGSSGLGLEGRYKSDTWWYPNVPPLVDHTPDVRGTFPETQVRLTATINDIEDDAIEAFVFFKTSNKDEYRSTPMQKNADGSWSGTIPANFVEPPGLHYYIGAIDRNGSNDFNYWSNENQPYLVTVANHGRVSVTIENEAARKAGARWRVIGEEEWYRSGETARLIQPGTARIEFKPLDEFHRPKIKKVKVINGRLSTTSGKYIPRD
jgi:hypothetical protein